MRGSPGVKKIINSVQGLYAIKKKYLLPLVFKHIRTPPFWLQKPKDYRKAQIGFEHILTELASETLSYVPNKSFLSSS